MNKYILDFEYESGFNAGSKARDDVEFFLKNVGFVSVTLKKSSSIVHKLLKPVTLIRDLNKILNESVVIIQHPCYVKKWYIEMIIRILKRKNVKIICLIHDLNSLRNAIGDTDILDEINLLNNFDVVISHNESMTKWLKNQNLNSPIINLEIFDYQTDDFQVDLNAKDKNSIAIAGNLIKEKSGYIYKLNEQKLKGITLNLYGNGYKADQEIENINYHGALPPNELPLKIKGGYGLIWDGPSIDKCEGEYGEYTRYNNPHKLSLYIASGLPVIVWSEAAIAEFVNENNIGLVVDSLEDLSNILINIDQQNYEMMQNNVQKVRKRVIEGYHTIHAVDRGLELI